MVMNPQMFGFDIELRSVPPKPSKIEAMKIVFITVGLIGGWPI